jgi:hypothetical protein
MLMFSMSGASCVSTIAILPPADYDPSLPRKSADVVGAPRTICGKLRQFRSLPPCKIWALRCARSTRRGWSKQNPFFPTSPTAMDRILALMELTGW